MHQLNLHVKLDQSNVFQRKLHHLNAEIASFKLVLKTCHLIHYIQSYNSILIFIQRNDIKYQCLKDCNSDHFQCEDPIIHYLIDYFIC